MHRARSSIKNSARCCARKHDPRFWRIAVMLLLISALGIRNIPRLLLCALEIYSTQAATLSTPAHHPPTTLRRRYIFARRTSERLTSARVQVWARRHLKCKFIQLWNRAEHWTSRWCMTKFIFLPTEPICAHFSTHDESSLARSDGKFRNVLFSGVSDITWHTVRMKSRRISQLRNHLFGNAENHFLIAYHQVVFPLFRRCFSSC